MDRVLECRIFGFSEHSLGGSAGNVSDFAICSIIYECIEYMKKFGKQKKELTKQRNESDVDKKNKKQIGETGN